MDSVPLDFCERVTATSKCCEAPILQCSCVLPQFSDRKWTFTERTRVELNIVPAEEAWAYGFRVDGWRLMTMNELLERPDFKKLRIDLIRINTMIEKDRHAVSDVGMKKLLNFVSFLSNESEVRFFVDERKIRPPEGEMLLEWMKESWFSSMSFWPYQSIHNRLVQKQLSRRKPTTINTYGNSEDLEFIAEKLKSGELTLCTAYTTSCSWALEVMEGIIESFVHAASKKTVKVEARFEDSTEGRLQKMREEKLCRKIDQKFIFENEFQRLAVARCGLAWRFTSFEKEQ